MATTTDVLLKPLHGSGLERVDAAEAASLEARGTLVRDPVRTRPRWFDGRFLTASDLTSEQTYTLARLAEVGRALGAGIGEGLAVTRVTASSTRLNVAAGYGVTPGGELVGLSEGVTVDLADVARSQQLDASFGLKVLPNPPAHGLDGPYVLALRPVEYTASATAAYPTSITGTRKVEDGAIVDATVLTLIPYTSGGSARGARSRIARQVFIEGRDLGLPVAALPLAMVFVSNGLIVDLDVHLVRRELGAARAGLFGFGVARRAVATAWLLQYSEQIRAIEAANPSRVRTASDHLEAVPPIGILPAETIDAAGSTQRFFPPEVSVQLALIPQDELPALVQERLLLPPIDLHASGEALAGVAVDVLIAVDRKTFQEALARVTAPTTRLTTPVRTAWARQSPLAMVEALRMRRGIVTAPGNTDDTVSPWVSIVQQAGPFLWYARRPSYVNGAEHLLPGAVLDTDLDGLTDAAEFALGLDPKSSDTDGDGVDDLTELRTGGLSTATANAVVGSHPYNVDRTADMVTVEASLSKIVRSTALARAPILRMAFDVALAKAGRLDMVEAEELRLRFTQRNMGKGMLLATEKLPWIAKDAEAMRLAKTDQVPELDVLLQTEKFVEPSLMLLKKWQGGGATDADLAEFVRKGIEEVR